MTTDDPAPGRKAFSTAPARSRSRTRAARAAQRPPTGRPPPAREQSRSSTTRTTTARRSGCAKATRPAAAAPWSRPPARPRSTSGPRSRQYRGCPSRQFRQDPHHGQPITTLSPTATLVTPEPTAATIPAPSCPSTPGAGNGISPSRAIASVWHTPLATTFTSASPGPGESTSTSATLKGVNSFSKTAAVARISLARRPRRRRGSSRRVDRRPDRQPRVRHRPVGVVEQVHEGKEPVDLRPEVPVLHRHPRRPQPSRTRTPRPAAGRARP